MERIGIALKIFEEHQGNLRLSLTATSRLLGLSQAHFSRLFKLQVGKSLNQYFRETRMTRAAKLLEQHNLPIKEIARHCGYADLSNFYRDFKQVHGVTPKQIRNRESAFHAQADKVADGQR